MKRTILLLIFATILALLPMHRAFMANRQTTKDFGAPTPPFKNRKASISHLSYLHKPGHSFSHWTKKGKWYLARKEFEQAIWAFRKARDLRPADAATRFFLAISYERRGQEGLPGDETNWDKLATGEYLAAINLADHLIARYNLALLMERNGEITNARKHLEHILVISPNTRVGRLADVLLSRMIERKLRPDHLSVGY